MWTRDKAVSLARELEMVCIKHRCHIALTGGLLYKDGERKDADFLIYRDRDAIEIDAVALFKAFERCGVTKVRGDGWVIKAKYVDPADPYPKVAKYMGIDFLFPEEDRHNIPHESPRKKSTYS